ncbi:MAG: DUF3488 domain-containing protein [Phycisphaerales bacterium]|nr:DUF3488 domain-containing protein [Phycisphaerales bacterium]
MTTPPSISDTRLSKIYHRSLLLTMLGATALFALADLSPSFLLIGLAGSLIGYWYAVQGPSSISRIAINALLAVVVALGLTNALKGNFSVSSFAFFSLLLMVLKLFDLRTPRDHGQILVLSLALIIAAALTSNSMPVGLGVFIMGFIFIRAMMLFRLYALAHKQNQSNPFLPIASIDLRSMQTITGFTCSIVALLIFLIMPRSLGNNTLGQWGVGVGVGGAGEILTTGFDDDVHLGRPGRITNSTTPVLRMTIKDRNDKPVGGTNSRAIYLRGSVLTQYQNGSWIAHQDQNIPITFRTRIIKNNQSIPIVNDNSRANWSLEYHITFDRQEQNYGYLFTPWKPLELKINTTQSRVGIDPDTRMILLASQPINAYRIRTSNPELEPIQIPEIYQRPPVNQAGITTQITALAYQILTKAGIDPNPKTRPPHQDIQAVRAIETHLRTQFSYTLISDPVPPNRDATEWFLFDHRKGHCEYYASALTLLTRSIGVPARVITGYVAAEFNDVTNYFTVRESNAHAWVEAMVAPDFWRTFDGTPQSDFHAIHEPQPSILHTISKFYEAIEHAWVTAVIGYDSDSRTTVFGDIDSDFGLGAFANNLQDRIATDRSQLLKQALITAGSIFVATMLIGLALIFLTKLPILTATKSRLNRILTLNPKHRARRRAQHTSEKLTKLIHTHLSTAGYPCPQGLPLRTHISTIDPPTSLQITPITKAADLLYTHHFATPKNKPTQSQFIENAQNLIKHLR